MAAMLRTNAGSKEAVGSNPTGLTLAGYSAKELGLAVLLGAEFFKLEKFYADFFFGVANLKLKIKVFFRHNFLIKNYHVVRYSAF
jgi:hypothetical protein